MKFAITAGLVAVTQAAKVHKFFAENNFICSMCQTVVDHARSGNDDMIDDIDGEASGEFLLGLIEQEGAFIGTAGAENE